MTEDTELETKPIIEITEAGQIQEADIEQIRSLIEKQREEMLPKPGELKYFEGRDHSALFGQGLKMANLVEYGMYKGFINKALENSNLVGFSVVALNDEGTVVGTFTGVDWNHTGKGIGVQLLAKRHEELKRRGITQYQTSVWDASVKMINKSGVKCELNDDENDGKPIATIYL